MDHTLFLAPFFSTSYTFFCPFQEGPDGGSCYGARNGCLGCAPWLTPCSGVWRYCDGGPGSLRWSPGSVGLNFRGGRRASGRWLAGGSDPGPSPPRGARDMAPFFRMSVDTYRFLRCFPENTKILYVDFVYVFFPAPILIASSSCF